MKQKQVIDVRAAKSFTTMQSNEHLRIAANGAFKNVKSHNFDPSREHLNFEVKDGNIVPVDKKTSIPKRIAQSLAARGIINPNAGLKIPKYRTHADIILGGSREQMRKLAFGEQEVDFSRCDPNNLNDERNKNIMRSKAIEEWAIDSYKFIEKKFGKENISAADMERERERLRKKMAKTQSGMTLEKKKPKKQHKPSDFRLGESVKVLSMNLTGTVSSLPDAKGNLFVQMGILRSQVNISDLEIIEEPMTITAKQMRRTSTGKMKMSKSLAVSPEINLLGKTVDEAIAELDKYLDDAYIAHVSPVRIVHGKGTGALRNGIHSYLKRQKHVKSYRLGAFGEGDAGVTIVEFK